ncbi:MAG: AbrB/MazE/SpoVT family DNA-binding domain-containing protein [Candidatus Methanosuratincola petrocarbonis]
MYCSKVTRKGQTTIPAAYRKKYGLREGTKVAFKETAEGIVIEPLPDIADSAGSMAKYGNAKEIVEEMTRERKEPFR